jgi:hypothetical protein
MYEYGNLVAFGVRVSNQIDCHQHLITANQLGSFLATVHLMRINALGPPTNGSGRWLDDNCQCHSQAHLLHLFDDVQSEPQGVST